MKINLLEKVGLLRVGSLILITVSARFPKGFSNRVISKI